MPRVAPFAGLRYDTTVAGPLAPLTAPPYDVISEPHRTRFARSSPYNVVHVDLGHAAPDVADEDPYARAGALLDAWRSAGALRRDAEASYYAYEAAWEAREGVASGRIRGVFVALGLQPWGGSVVPHEDTMPGP